MVNEKPVTTHDDILNVIKMFPGITPKEISKTTKRSYNFVTVALRTLINKKEIFKLHCPDMVMDGKYVRSAYFDKSCLEFFER